jgi:REP element-mobilizing transposase RayT
MARALRVHAPGVAVHVMSRGNNKQAIFLDAADYAKYLELLALLLGRFKIRCHAFCLLFNHLHLIITPGPMPISRMMQQLNSKYCAWFNEKHGRVGHLLQDRYKAKLIDDGSYFLNVVRYVALNPVVAAQVDRPEDWPWSSYRAAIGLEAPIPFVDDFELARALDAIDDAERHARLKTFVEAGQTAEDGWRELMSGSDDLGRRVEPLIADSRADIDFSYAHRYATRPALESLLKGQEGEALRSAVHDAFVVHAYTLREIAAQVDKHPGTVWTWVQSVARQRLTDTA